MPNIKSAKKRVLLTKKRTLRNKGNKSFMKTTIKKYRTAVETGDRDSVTKLLPDTVSTIDKAVAKGIMHKNTAARKKRQLAVMLNKMG